MEIKPTIVSGIKPSGRLHLGNYLGVLKNLVDIQNENAFTCFFFLADLHSLTESYTPQEKKDQVFDLAASLLSLGLDPQKAILFQQSQVESHTQLSWIFSTLMPMGELRRMTQFKDKSGDADDSSTIVNVGLFTYPLLMAADILMYNPAFVPVGDDQLQHLELTRTIARKFNTRFGDTFQEPAPRLTTSPRIMSLANPAKKMSKSIPTSCVFIDDDEKTIHEKLSRAVTDSGNEIVFDEEKKPGISNLLKIASELTAKSVSQLEKDFANIPYATFKSEIATIITDHFAPYREKKKNLFEDKDYVVSMFKAGSEQAEEKATETIDAVKEKIGLSL